jgi:hypothetical protein
MTQESAATPLDVHALALRALEEGIKQVEAVGSPLHPFLLDETAKAYFLFDNEGGVDPMQMALLAIQRQIPHVQRCALLIDTRIALADGKRWDALVAMACARDEDEGVVLAQRYVPKGWFRKFRLEGQPEALGKSRNFIRVALEAQDEAAEEGARDLLTRLQATYQPTHRYRDVSAQDFGHLDLAFYDTTLRRLQAEGYAHLADVEDETITAAGGVLARIMIRSMLSADGTVMASAYDPKLTPEGLAMLGKHPPSVLDFETEFEDGAFVVTSNATAAGSIALPPMVMSEFLPADTPLAQLLARHLQRIAAYAEVSGVATRPVADHAALIAAQNRQNALKAAFRNELGGISAAELQALAGEHAALAARMHEKLERLRREGA